MTTADTTTVRSWARNNGFTTGDRGRLSETILAAYAKAHVAAPTARPAKTAKTAKTAKAVKTVELAATTAKPKQTRARRAPANAPSTNASSTSSTTRPPRQMKPAAPKKASPARKAPAKKAAKRPVAAAAPKSTFTELLSDTAPATRTVTARPKTRGSAAASREAGIAKSAPRRRTPTAPQKPTDAPAEAVTADRIVALEKRVADLTSRLMAVETAVTTAAARHDTTSPTKTTRKFGHRK